jgi:hypothetical protein
LPAHRPAGQGSPSLLRYYYTSLTPHDQAALDRISGSTLGSWLEFAGIDDTRPFQGAKLREGRQTGGLHTDAEAAD